MPCQTAASESAGVAALVRVSSATIRLAMRIISRGEPLARTHTSRCKLIEESGEVNLFSDDTQPAEYTRRRCDNIVSSSSIDQLNLKIGMRSGLLPPSR